MKNFAICLVVLNLLYLTWNMGFLPGSGNEDVIVIREPTQQAPQSLVMLSELSDLQPAETSLSDSVIEEVFIEPTNTVANGESILACLAIGDFENVAVSNALVSELRNQGLQARIELQEQIESEYRVYMPPFSSDAAARQTLASLLGSGIDRNLCDRLLPDAMFC